jgi:hypothetical protein
LALVGRVSQLADVRLRAARFGVTDFANGVGLAKTKPPKVSEVWRAQQDSNLRPPGS